MKRDFILVKNTEIVWVSILETMFWRVAIYLELKSLFSLSIWKSNLNSCEFIQSGKRFGL